MRTEAPFLSPPERPESLKGHTKRLGGSYIICIQLTRPKSIAVGALGTCSFPSGLYVYVGSARNSMVARVERHKRLAVQKVAIPHWHIDHLLVDPHCRWLGAAFFENKPECKTAAWIAGMDGATAPVEGFGSTDCHHGCKAHLYLLRQQTVTAFLKEIMSTP